MNLKGLATQLECQGVDPGYIQRFDWEKWILRMHPENREPGKSIKSRVLHLLQEYFRVVDEEKALQEELEDLRGDLEDSRNEVLVLKRSLTRAKHEVELSLEREKTLRGAIHRRDDGI